MLDDCLEALNEYIDPTRDELVFADMTFGGGGHTLAFAKNFKNAHIYSVDQDMDAIHNGLSKIESESFSNRIFLNKMNYEQFPNWFIENYPNSKLDAVVMDLGVSSHHFDKDERGFSFRNDAPLDMRMDYTDENLPNAADVLNSLDEEDIADIIYKYGEDRFSRRIAAEIVSFRKTKPLETTKELENIVFHAYPKNLRHKKTHPATRTFQALRIYVNRELEVLENACIYFLIDEYENLLENQKMLLHSQLILKLYVLHSKMISIMVYVVG